jgi:aminobenzoyl-glutamate transport protein
MPEAPAKPKLLDRALTTIEWLGNKLPDPIFLFLGATLLVMALSAVGASMDWSVQPVKPQAVTALIDGVATPTLDTSGKPVLELVPSGTPIGPRNLITSDGIYWLVANMVRNFINFAPLGVVLVSMFGIGLAEKVGLFGAAMRYFAAIVPGKALTPMIVFLGVMSNTASDAGYIILPPLAAALYLALGRPPLAGIAAAFAGVAGGFSANLLIASTDALIAPLTERGARVLDANYTVLPTCNWYFLAASTFVVTLMGWFVTAKIVEPRLVKLGGFDVSAAESQSLSELERKGLRWALTAIAVAAVIITASIAIPGAPLSGNMPAPAPTFGPIPVDPPATPPTAAAQPRWSQAIVPYILIGFLLPGLAYGIATGSIRKTTDVTKAFVHSMATMAPIIAMAFFAAQFIECFRFSRLDAMLANAGGKALVAADLPKPLLLVGVIMLVMVINILMSSMSAKWTALAAILVPMLMMAGISPELTQAAYRVGDSVTNIVTPLNSYIIVILAAVQRYRKDAGIGNLIAMMLPYSVVYFIVWTLFLLGWVALELPLGPKAPLWYTPGQ